MLTRRTIVQTSLAAGTVAGLAGIAMYANWRLAQGPEPADGWWPAAWPSQRFFRVLKQTRPGGLELRGYQPELT